MTHNIQFGVNIDDEAIQKGVEQGAIHDIQRGLFGCPIIRTTYDSYKFSEEFKRNYLNRFFEEILENSDMKKQIAKMVAYMVADRLMRSPKFKETVKDKIGGK